jgi:hypothetical protein
MELMKAYAKFKKNLLPDNNEIVQMERKRQGTSAPAPTCRESPSQPTEETALAGEELIESRQSGMR